MRYQIKKLIDIANNNGLNMARRVKSKAINYCGRDSIPGSNASIWQEWAILASQVLEESDDK